MQLLKKSLPPFTLPAEANVNLDVRVLVYTAGLVVLTGILFGMAPAWHSLKVNAADALKEGGRSSTASGRGVKVRGALIVAEIALAFVLLTGAGLLIRSFYRLQQVNTGFDGNNVVTMWLPMDDKQFDQGPQIVNYLKQIIQQTQSVPGVSDVATT